MSERAWPPVDFSTPTVSQQTLLTEAGPQGMTRTSNLAIIGRPLYPLSYLRDGWEHGIRTRDLRADNAPGTAYSPSPP